MFKNNHIINHRKGLTLLEMVIALSIIVVVISAMLPQLVAVNKSWDSRRLGSEALQNGRILVDHINRNLATAAKIIDVSEPAATSGFLEFEDHNGDTYRYEVSAGNMVQFGLVGSLFDLAGPVSNFQLTCYDDNDLDTALVIADDGVDDIRFVTTDITMTNSAALGQDKNLVASAYLRTSTTGELGLIAHWAFDEVSGKTASDSSGNDYHGDLKKMAGDEWTNGMIGGALEFDGNDDYVFVAGVLGEPAEFSLCAWMNLINADSLGAEALSLGDYEFLRIDDVEVLYGTYGGYYSTDDNWKCTTTQQFLMGTGWHHVAYTFDDTNNIQKYYIDGIEAASSTYARSIKYTASSFDTYIGKHGDGKAGFQFGGVIDDVRVYDRPLTAEEVAMLASILRLRDYTETKTGSATTTSITLNIPSDTVEDDLLIAAISVEGNESSNLAPPSGEGWTLIDTNSSSGAVSLAAWWKLADASESTSHTFTWGSNHYAYAWMMRFSGHDTSDPIDTHSSSQGSSASPTSPSVSVSGKSLILRLGAFYNSDIIEDDPGLTDHTAITMDSSAGAVYHEFTETKVNSNNTSITLSTPASTSAGDLLIAAVVTDDWTSGTLSPPGGGGWNEINIDDTSNNVTLGAWYKNAGASEPPTHQFTWSWGQEAYGWIMRFTGHDAASPINVAALNYGTTIHPISPAVTTTVDNCLILRLCGFQDDKIKVDSTGLYGHTDITMDKSGGPDDCSGGAGYLIQSNAGATGTSNFWMTAPKKFQTLTVAIEPDTGATTSVSGGAAYEKMLAGGSSGSSNFSLTSPNDYCTLTIGITASNENFAAEIIP